MTFEHTAYGIRRSSAISEASLSNCTLTPPSKILRHHVQCIYCHAGAYILRRVKLSQKFSLLPRSDQTQSANEIYPFGKIEK